MIKNSGFWRVAGLGLLSCVLWLASCRQHDLRTVTIKLPGLKNEACVEVVRKSLAAVGKQPGLRGAIDVRSAEFSLEQRTVTLTYDSMCLALKNLEHYIADAGFAANDTPPNARAVKALPEECR